VLRILEGAFFVRGRVGRGLEDNVARPTLSHSGTAHGRAGQPGSPAGIVKPRRDDRSRSPGRLERCRQSSRVTPLSGPACSTRLPERVPSGPRTHPPPGDPAR
jgi:hypothetical protein